MMVDKLSLNCSSNEITEIVFTTEEIKQREQEDQQRLEEEANRPPTETELLKAQNKALSDRTEFLEDIIAEMAMKVYA